MAVRTAGVRGYALAVIHNGVVVGLYAHVERAKQKRVAGRARRVGAQVHSVGAQVHSVAGEVQCVGGRGTGWGAGARRVGPDVR